MYILILTMVFKFGQGGMGGVEVHEFKDYESCNKVGAHWVAGVKKHHPGRFYENRTAFFDCVKVDNRGVSP